MKRSVRNLSSSPLARWTAGMTIGLGTLMAASPAARAAEDEEHYDGRVQGYTPSAEAKSSSSGGAWMLLALMGAACVGVMFMDAKRTHLD